MSDDKIKILTSLPTWSHKILDITPLSGGMTNENFLVDDGTKKYVARFAPLKTDTLGLSRDYEIYNANVAFHINITAPVVANFPEHRLLIVEFISGAPLNVTTAIQDQTMQKVAMLLKKLHSALPFQNKRNQFQYTRHYLHLAQKHRGWTPNSFNDYLKYLDAIEAKLPSCIHTCPCHLDLVLDNIILQPNGEIKLIDWEYSADSDFRYDLAMFLSRIKASTAQKKTFLSTYGVSNVGIMLREVELFELVVHLAEAAFGMLQTAIATKESVDYRAYAESQLACFDQKIATYLHV